MDGIPLEQLESVFDKLDRRLFSTSESFGKKLDQQNSTLNKLQEILGQKIDTITDYEKTIAEKFEALKEYIKSVKSTVNKTDEQKNKISKPTLTEEVSDKSKEEKSSKPEEDGLKSIKLVSSSAASIPTSLKVLPVRVVDDPKKKESEKKDTKNQTKEVIVPKKEEKVKEIVAPKKEEKVKEVIAPKKEEKVKEVIAPKKEEKKGITNDTKEPKLFASLLSALTKKDKKPQEEKIVRMDKIEKPSNKSPYSHDSVNILIPAETEVKLQNIIGDTLKPYFDDLRDDNDRLRKTIGIPKKEKEPEKKKNWLEALLAGSMIAKLIGMLLKPFTALAGLILKPFKWLAGKLLEIIPKVLYSAGRLVFSVVKKLLGPLMPLLAGAGLAIAGVLTLLSGLKDSGPYKGIKKVLGKGLLSVGMAILKKEFGKLGKMATEALSHLKTEFGKLGKYATNAIKGLAKGGFIRNFIAATKKGFRNIFRTITKLPEKLFGGITKAIKGMFGGLAGKATGALAKGGGKSLISKLAGTAGKFLLKGLKRLPLIGTLIGLGYAFSRIMKGDFIGGALDIASAIAAAVPVVGTALSIAIDLFSAYRDTQTGGSEKAGKAQMGWIEGAKKWISERVKYIPVIGPLIDMAKAIGDGNYLDALGYLAKAAIPPLGIIIDLFNSNQEAITSAATTAGNWVSDASDWIYNKVKELPIIGSLIKAGEAIAGGKWGDVLGYLGEAIEPLQYIGKLIESGAESVANAVTTGDFSSIKSFFVSIKDSLIKAVLNMLPDEIWGISIRSRVAKMLGIEGYGDVKDGNSAAQGANNQAPAVPPEAAKVANIPANVAQKEEKPGMLGKAWGFTKGLFGGSKEETPTTQSTSENQSTPPAVQSAEDDDDEESTPRSPVTPVEPTTIPKETNDEDDTSDNTGEMTDSLKEHSNLLKMLVEYQKHTANNTKALITALAKSQGGNQNNIVNNVSSPTNFISAPTSNTSFRQAVLQR